MAIINEPSASVKPVTRLKFLLGLTTLFYCYNCFSYFFFVLILFVITIFFKELLILTLFTDS